MARSFGSRGSTKVPSAAPEAKFVLGSRPAAIRAPAISDQRIKPAQGQRQYGKGSAPQSPFSTLGNGDTGNSGMT